MGDGFAFHLTKIDEILTSERIYLSRCESRLKKKSTSNNEVKFCWMKKELTSGLGKCVNKKESRQRTVSALSFSFVSFSLSLSFPFIYVPKEQSPLVFVLQMQPCLELWTGVL